MLAPTKTLLILAINKHSLYFIFKKGKISDESGAKREKPSF